MDAEKTDFSISAHLLPHFNREGMRFGTAAFVLAFFFAGGAVALSGVELVVRVGQTMVAGETVLGSFK